MREYSKGPAPAGPFAFSHQRAMGEQRLESPNTYLGRWGAPRADRRESMRLVHVRGLFFTTLLLLVAMAATATAGGPGTPGSKEAKDGWANDPHSAKDIVERNRHQSKRRKSGPEWKDGNSTHILTYLPTRDLILPSDFCAISVPDKGCR